MRYNPKDSDDSSIKNDCSQHFKTESIPIDEIQIIPLDVLAQSCGSRLRRLPNGHYTKTMEIEDLAVKSFRTNGQGINFTNVICAGLAMICRLLKI